MRKAPFTKSELEIAISDSLSWAETLRRMGYCPSGSNPATVKKYVRLWKIDTSHFDPDRVRNNVLKNRKGRPLDEILVRRSTYSRGHLKRRLYREGLKEPRCELCGQGEIWRGERISLILDHINGERDDHRLENLRIVCPNCAATLPTHCGRGLRKPRPPKVCGVCGREFTPGDPRKNFCSRECGQRVRASPPYPRPGGRKVERPPYERLIAEIEAMGYSAVGRKYGVSDNGVRKWVRWYELEKQREQRDRNAGGVASDKRDAA